MSFHPLSTNEWFPKVPHTTVVVAYQQRNFTYQVWLNSEGVNHLGEPSIRRHPFLTNCLLCDSKPEWWSKSLMVPTHTHTINSETEKWWQGDRSFEERQSHLILSLRQVISACSFAWKTWDGGLIVEMLELKAVRAFTIATSMILSAVLASSAIGH